MHADWECSRLEGLLQQSGTVAGNCRGVEGARVLRRLTDSSCLGETPRHWRACPGGSSPEIQDSQADSISDFTLL